jgi:hypothetical protein
LASANGPGYRASGSWPRPAAPAETAAHRRRPNQTKSLRVCKQNARVQRQTLAAAEISPPLPVNGGLGKASHSRRHPKTPTAA